MRQLPRDMPAWRKENPIGSNWLNPDDYDADPEGVHYLLTQELKWMCPSCKEL